MTKDSGNGPNLFGLIILASEPFSTYLSKRIKKSDKNSRLRNHSRPEMRTCLLKNYVKMRLRLKGSEIFDNVFVVQILSHQSFYFSLTSSTTEITTVFKRGYIFFPSVPQH